MKINVNSYVISPSRLTVGTVGSYGTSLIEFSFDSSWADLVKKITFYPVADDPVCMIIIDDRVHVPYEVMKTAGEGRFVVSGIRGEDALISAEGQIIVLPTLTPVDTPPGSPTPSEMAQVLELMQLAVDSSGGIGIVSAADARDAAELARNAAFLANNAYEAASAALTHVNTAVSDMYVNIQNVLNTAVSGNGSPLYVNVPNKHTAVTEGVIDINPRGIKILGNTVQPNVPIPATSPTTVGTPIIGVENPYLDSYKKNLFNQSTAVSNKVLNDTGTPVTAVTTDNFEKRMSVTDYMKVIPGQNYTVFNSSSINSSIYIDRKKIKLAFYDKNMSFMSLITHENDTFAPSGESVTHISIPFGCYYIRDMFVTVNLNKYMLAVGWENVFPISAVFEKQGISFGNITLHGLADVNGRIENDCRDSIEVVGSRVIHTKRVGISPHDAGTATILYTDADMIALGITDTERALKVTGCKASSTAILCSHLPSSPLHSVDGHIFFRVNGNTPITASNLTHSQICSDFLLVYPLAQPVVTDITDTPEGQALLVFKLRLGSNTLCSNALLSFDYSIDPSVAYRELVNAIITIGATV